MPKDPLDRDAALEGLNRALALQFRSALQYALASGSATGLEFAALAQRYSDFAQEELADAARLVEKIVALDGEPTTEVAPIRWDGDPVKMVDRLIETEGEALDSLQEVIPATGQEGEGEALEHRMEHMIMRKQEQIDSLIRARRGA
jgi:bacterioferritin (cytochrome b1)